MRTKVQVPWPLGEGQFYDHGTGRWCFTGWHGRCVHPPPEAAVLLNSSQMARLREATIDAVHLSAVELNDGSLRGFPTDLSDEERCMVLCMGLYAAGYEPIVVDKDTAEPL